MPAHHEQVGQRAGHQQAMRVLLQPAIAHLGKAEHPLDDPDRMFDPGPHFRLGAVFRPLDLIDNTAGRTVLSATLAGVDTTAWISLVRLSTPKCAFIPKYH